MTTQDYYDAPQHPTKKRHPVRNTLLVLLALLVAVAVVVAGYAFSLATAFNSRTTTIESAFPEDSTRPTRPAAAEGAMNILLMGSDARAAETAGESNLPETPEGSRSDTMMLMHIPKDRANIYVMSIMRDTWTEIPGYGMHKINAAMSFGGVPLVVQTVEGMFDAPIDHVVIVDFEGFKGLTDALGGVTVDNPIAFQSEGVNGEFFEQGPITLDGESALKFVRERYAFADGDYQRVRNQQLYIKAVMSEFLSGSTLTNPAKVSRIVNEISPYLSVDEQFDAAAVGSLAFSLRNVRTDDVKFFTLPNLGVGTSPDGQSIVVKDEAAIAEIAAALDEGTLGDYLETANLSGQGA
ncbi:LCP family protein required for cell wall assembly [Arthrobacter pigmenti]|uniref:LCP family protein required for cell wall assembly n=1 Tax=Arthrobacter pigmenti TaxID=271432 RepID=A0A846RHM7_9MICC|nr:LCP family protein [Arthrobacter pigmenti]NJC22663.1 LCP family protein required for cell wall assembly [Arthrobacter pigmenti]